MRKYWCSPRQVQELLSFRVIIFYWYSYTVAVQYAPSFFFVICLYVHTQYIYSSLIMTIIARETISMNLSGTMHGFVSHLPIM